MGFECRHCAAERECVRRTAHARAVWLAWGRDEPAPECGDFVERRELSRGEEWRRWRRSDGRGHGGGGERARF